MKPTASAEPPVAAAEDTTLRPVIAASWKRSSACGVDRGRRAELPYDEYFDDDSRLMRAARPVLERLVTTLADTPNTLLLADREARLIQRNVGKKSLFKALDEAGVAPGFGFHEEFAGTNGVGTALEESTPVVVRGDEHYSDFLQHLSCVGVPIHHPITSGVEGILDLTCLARDYNPLMPSLLVEAVKHIETRMTQMSSPSEVALLESFVRHCRRHRGAVIALRPNMVLTNPAAVEHLKTTDHAVLWDAASTLAAGDRSEGSVDLEGGRFRVRCTVVEAGPTRPDGMVLRLDPAAPSGTVSAARGAAGRSVPGRSSQWRRVLARIEDLAGDGRPVMITGEPGVGKLWLAERLHQRSGGDAGLRIVDCRGSSGATTSDLVGSTDEAWSAGDTVVLRGVDALPGASLARLQALIESAWEVRPGRLIVTARSGGDAAGTLNRLVASFPHQLSVPPLDQRAEDIADLAPALLADLTGGASVYCPPPVIQVLMRCTWSGNVAELREALAAAVAVGTGREIEVRQLPAWVVKRANRRQLTPMERSDRDLIIETLASVGDNRSEAARILGIGRATLYRKMRNLGIATDAELAR